MSIFSISLADFLTEPLMVFVHVFSHVFLEFLGFIHVDVLVSLIVPVLLRTKPQHNLIRPDVVSACLPSRKDHVLCSLWHLVLLYYILDRQGFLIDATHHRNLLLRDAGVLPVIVNVPLLVLLGVAIAVQKGTELFFWWAEPGPLLRDLVINMPLQQELLMQLRPFHIPKQVIVPRD